MGTTKRVAKWDNIKFILIVCVVLGHFLSRYSGDYINARRLIFFIYTFHMPAFVFLSGLFANRTIHEKRYDKIFSFLLMFLVAKTALFLIQFVRGAGTEFSYFEMNDVSWYAFAIFIFYLLTVFLQQFDWKYLMIGTVLFSCISGYATDIDTFLSLSRIITYYPFFLMGIYMKPQKLLEFVKPLWVRIASWIFFLGVALVVYFKIDSVNWFLTILKGKRGYSYLKQYAEYGFVLRLFWYVFAVALIIAIVAIVPSIDCIVTRWGSRTFQVYVLHYIPMLAFFGIFKGEAWAQSVSPEHHLLIIVVVAIIVSIVLSIKPITIILNKIIYPPLRENGSQSGK